MISCVLVHLLVLFSEGEEFEKRGNAMQRMMKKECLLARRRLRPTDRAGRASPCLEMDTSIRSPKLESARWASLRCRRRWKTTERGCLGGTGIARWRPVGDRAAKDPKAGASGAEVCPGPAAVGRVGVCRSAQESSELKTFKEKERAATSPRRGSLSPFRSGGLGLRSKSRPKQGARAKASRPASQLCRLEAASCLR